MVDVFDAEGVADLVQNSTLKWGDCEHRMTTVSLTPVGSAVSGMSRKLFDRHTQSYCSGGISRGSRPTTAGVIMHRSVDRAVALQSSKQSSFMSS